MVLILFSLSFIYYFTDPTLVIQCGQTPPCVNKEVKKCEHIKHHEAVIMNFEYCF